MRFSRACYVAACIAAASALHPVAAAHAEAGAPVADIELPALDGGKARLLGNGANVLVFVRPNHDRSLGTLRQLGQCRHQFAGQPVRWVAIVSGTDRDSAKATLRDAALAMPVLVDEGDTLYASLGVALHPVTVIVGPDHKLSAFEPFRGINYCAVITARLRHLLGEITEAQMRQMIDPPAAAQGGDKQAALRYRALAEALYKSGNYPRAAENVRRSIEKDPTAAAAHALLGDILAAQGKCAEASGAYGKAREADPANQAALAGIKRCAK